MLNRGNRVSIQRKKRAKSRTVLIETVLTEESLYCQLGSSSEIEVPSSARLGSEPS
jgi:hypothetical protein